MSSKDQRYRNLQDRLREVELAKRALVANGQAYSIQGSHQVTMPEMKVLDYEAKQICKQMLRIRGVTKRHNYAGTSKTRGINA